MTPAVHIAMAEPASAVVDPWWLYLLLCHDGRTYVGIARDVQARFAMHVSGKGARFTRANRPVSILGVQLFESRSAASKAEHALKQRSRSERLAWATQRAASPPITPNNS